MSLINVGRSSLLAASESFGVKSINGDTIDGNGTYILNNWPEDATMVTNRVNPSVDSISLMSWDNAQSPVTYSKIELPLNPEGTSHIVIRYMTNNPVRIYRHKNSSSDAWKWYLVYDGYSHIRNLGSAPVTFDLKAGKHTIEGNAPILQANVTTSNNIDDFLKIRMVTTNGGNTLDCSMQLVSNTTLSTIHQHTSNNITTVSRVIGNLTTSTTSFIVDSASTSGEIAYIDTLIHKTSDGSGQWLRKYKGRFTHHSNNNIYYCLEREINPSQEV
ncbi:hypothetical protein S349_28 [Shewanella sp. phage 3/49]|uniref:hypothetical protein n=1 Tax=Shewanella sp. phage 3/49 TaxID=1458863 RepID=UPI0004F76E0B|nr:hypothetical protein S349_28 [Shewanella sp. phage 3/49]AHK11818.1 hypothetical protein S349_28 [Shewanella sp. phage 3/49]